MVDKSKRKDYLRAKIRRNTLTNALRHVGGVGDDNDDLERSFGPHYVS